MLTVYSTTEAGLDICVLLPVPDGWGIRTPRVQIEKKSLAGTMIRQTWKKHPSLGSAQFEAELPVSMARALESIDEEGLDVFLSDGRRVFLVIMDLAVSDGTTPGKKGVSCTFRVVRRVM